MPLPPSNGKTVLVSGINGYIASNIGLLLLEQGFTLRGTARNKATTDILLAGVYKDYADRVEMVLVPDIAIPGAFDEAVKGTHAILHTATPVSISLSKLSEFVDPAVGGVTTILNSALGHAGPQLEIVVVTSSLAAIVDPSNLAKTFTAADWNTWSQAEVTRNPNGPGLVKYQVAKVEAERAFWAFGEKHKPHFRLAAINPGVVTGPPVQPPANAETINLTTKPIWELLSAAPGAAVPPMFGTGTYIDVRDVSAMHVWAAAHPEKAAGQRYPMAAGRAPPQAVADILRKAYPNRKDIPVGEPGTGYEPGYVWKEGGLKFDSGAAEAVLGGFIGFEKSVIDTAKVFERYL